MEIILLGTGTAVPVKQHSPAALVVIADGVQLLFDIGPGTLSRLEQAGLVYTRLNHLLLTHFHPDHTLDLATLLLVFNYAPGAVRSMPFEITAPFGVEDFLQRMLQLYPELTPSEYELRLNHVRRDAFSIGNISILSAPTGHTPESVAYRVEQAGRSMVYSGDAAPQGELAQLAQSADLLICECSFPSGWQTQEHLNADNVGRIAQQAGVKSLLITHCYPPALAVDLIGQIRAHYAGELQLAMDGLHFSLS
jgi:ribonuclease BN (tRNA processing enzyme)